MAQVCSDGSQPKRPSPCQDESEPMCRSKTINKDHVILPSLMDVYIHQLQHCSSKGGLISPNEMGWGIKVFIPGHFVEMKYFLSRGSTPAKQPVCGDGSALNLNNFGEAANICHKFEKYDFSPQSSLSAGSGNELYHMRFTLLLLPQKPKNICRTSLQQIAGQTKVWGWRCEANLRGWICAKRFKRFNEHCGST